ncbi:MAG: hypothetical protein AAF329_25440, partial [Cyanobacteria bacterium P01_A01_bin.17]
RSTRSCTPRLALPETQSPQTSPNRVGVTPDVEVPCSVPYAQGADPQKEGAIVVALEAVKQQ